MTRIQELEEKMLDRTATEVEEFEYFELKGAIECQAPAQTVEEFKSGSLHEPRTDVGDFDAYLEYVAALEDSYEHKKYLAGSDKCFEEWCERENERRGG